MDRRGSIKECVEKYRDVCVRADYRGTDLIKFSKIHAKGHHLVLAYIKAIPGSGWYISTCTLGKLSPDKAKSIEAKLRRHICTRIIPHSGRSVLKESPSKFGILRVHRKHIDGTYINIPVLCEDVLPGKEPCGGRFKPNTLGEYVCEKCGIIHEYSDFREEEEDDSEDSEDESVYFDIMQSTPGEVRDTLNYVAHTYNRILPDTRHSANLEWKESLKTIPPDEISARKKARSIKDRHDECTSINRKTSKKYPRSKQEETYLAKWREAQRKSRLAKILFLVKEGINDTAPLLAQADCSNDTFYLDLGILEHAGRITSTKQGRRKILDIAYPLIPSTIFKGAYQILDKIKFDSEMPKKRDDKAISVYSDKWRNEYKV